MTVRQVCLGFWLAGMLACATSAAGQPPYANNSAAQPASNPLPLRSVLQLDQDWKFAVSDNPSYAAPDFNDSNWQTVNLSQPPSAQGIDSYSGYAWYRLRISPQQLAALGQGSRPMLLVQGKSVAQFAVYLNGLEMGRTRGMTESPSAYASEPLPAYLPEESGGHPLVIAVRTWVPAYAPVKESLLRSVQLGAEADIGKQLSLAKGIIWDDSVTARLLLSFLFLCMAFLGGALYVAQRNHPEYLWLSILCLTATAQGTQAALFSLSILTFGVDHQLDMCLGHLFMAVALEFFHHFTGVGSRRTIRILQIAILLVTFLSYLPIGDLNGLSVYNLFAVGMEIVFCAFSIGLLVRGWRKGSKDAGVMLLPFILAAAGHSADSFLSYAAYAHWIPKEFGFLRFHLGPIATDLGTLAYGVFLASLLAVILSRFIRVSQDEQRSSAEIAAARSVQSMLIPTHLPSSRNFMLESAYLPVNGVGGDFFQVLPLKDDSLLIVVGDVSGKGLQAAMNSSTLVGALRNELSHEPATVLGRLNRVLLGAGYTGANASSDAGPSFATCLCALAHPDGTLIISNAGHLGPYRDGRELEVPPGLPLGVIADVEYEQVTYQLEQGQRLVFLSDGVVEATNGEGELFGFERTQQVSNEPARYIAQTAKRFGQTDDITVVSLYMASCDVRQPAAELNPA